MPANHYPHNAQQAPESLRKTRIVENKPVFPNPVSEGRLANDLSRLVNKQ